MPSTENTAMAAISMTLFIPSPSFIKITTTITDGYVNLRTTNSYETVSEIMQPQVKVFRPPLFALLRAASLRLRIVVKKSGHGTETMKLCQEIVCPVDSFEYNEIYINNQYLTGICIELFYPFLRARRVSIRKFSSLRPAGCARARGPSPVIARESSLKNWRPTLKTCSSFTRSI